MSEAIFLIDSNSLITPHLTYYPFDFAPGFWNQMEQAIKNGKIAILDIVRSEILQGNDSLKEWMNALEIGLYVDHKVSTHKGQAKKQHIIRQLPKKQTFVTK